MIALAMTFTAISASAEEKAEKPMPIADCIRQGEMPAKTLDPMPGLALTEPMPTKMAPPGMMKGAVARDSAQHQACAEAMLNHEEKMMDAKK